MAKVFGETGATTEFLSRIHASGVTNIANLEDVRVFQSGYSKALDQIRQSSHTELIHRLEFLKQQSATFALEYEAKLKQRETDLLQESIEIRNWLNGYANDAGKGFRLIVNWFKSKIVSKRLRTIEGRFEEEKTRPFIGLASRIFEIKEELADKETHSAQWAEKMFDAASQDLRRINSVIEENRAFLYGAIGEEMVLDELRKLPDSFAVINDVRRKFDRPVVNKKTEDLIFSIQADHIVIGPQGLYLIETKNWSQASISNPDFFSPIKQLQRLSFVIFVLLNQAVESGELSSFRQQWGVQKISPKNILLMISNKIDTEFQYVKVLSLPEIRNYISYGKAVFSAEQVDELAEYLSRWR